MGIRETENAYIEDFKQLEDAESQCEYLLQLGMRQRIPEEELRRDAYRIEGCHTAIWLKTELRGDRVYFQGDSDSLLVKGILLILKEMYDGRAAGEAA